jgi:moderate conductance mechanosensitive channel
VAGAGFVGLAIAISAQQMVSRDWRRVLLGVEVARGADLGLVTRTVEQAAQEFHQDEQWRPWLLDEPEVWGVEGLEPESTTIRLALRTCPSKHDQVARELRARVDEALERAAIPLPSDTDHP